MTSFSNTGAVAAPSPNAGAGPGWFFIFMAAVLFGVGVLAIARPNTQLFGQRGRGYFRQANQWQYVDDDGPERSRAGLLFVRGIGCLFLLVAVGVLVAGIRNL